MVCKQVLGSGSGSYSRAWDHSFRALTLAGQWMHKISSRFVSTGHWHGTHARKRCRHETWHASLGRARRFSHFQHRVESGKPIQAGNVFDPKRSSFNYPVIFYHSLDLVSGAMLLTHRFWTADANQLVHLHRPSISVR